MDHDHQHSHEPYAAREHPEFVVLDIGDGVGGLIIHTDPQMHGIEIEISPSCEDHRRSHKEVLQRQIGDRPAFTAVFDGLQDGDYTLWCQGQARARDVRVQAGAVRELDWRGKAA